VCVILGSAAAYGVVEYRYARGDFQPVNNVIIGNPSTPGATPTPAPELAQQVTTSVSGEIPPQMIYDIALNQVVGVRTEGSGGYSGGSYSTVLASGSGFIISNDGYILTNHHVIESSISRGYKLMVYLQDGTAYEAKVVGYESENDVAVLKIDAKALNPVTTGNSDAIRVGDSVYAVGDPLGLLKYTMTDGIVSALDRVITVDRNTTISMFQISAAVNSGNSGGPVYNSKGEVIGIVSAKYADVGVEGLGFAIPINDAVHIAEQLITNGYVADKAYLGITSETVTDSAAAYYNMVKGAYVKSVESGTSAEKAGLKLGDIITKLGDITVTSSETLVLAMRKYSPGDTVDIVVNRSGDALTLTATLGKREAEEQQTSPSERQQESGEQSFPSFPIIPFPW
jgi:serine protease Do